MQKKRINEIKKGLENEIYTKIKDIETEKTSDNRFSQDSNNYTSTDFLADILPKKNVSNDTVEILNKNSVDLELDRKDVLKKYDEYLHEGDDKDIFDEEDPEIPQYETEEHIKVIEEELENVEIKYKKEEEEELEKTKEEYSLEDDLDISYDEEFSEEKVTTDDDDIDLDDVETKIIDDKKLLESEDLKQVHLDLANDFATEDELIVPKVLEEKAGSINESQFIFEEDIEDEVEFESEEDLFDTPSPVLKYDENEEEVEEYAEEEYDDEEFDNIGEDTEDLNFWESEDKEHVERKYVDIILFLIIIVLVLVVIFIIF